MIELTPEQVAELDRTKDIPLVAQNITGERRYVLVPEAAYREGKEIFDAFIERARSATDSSGKSASQWDDEKNARRLKLIDLKYSRGLTPEEDCELQSLQTHMAALRQELFPLPLTMLDLIEAGLRNSLATRGKE